MENNLADLRREYSLASLDIDSVDKDPMAQFRKWFEEAQKSELLEPNAMVVSTVDAEGQPFQRTVLMKAMDEKGIVFYTNYASRKAKQLGENPKISLLFPWYGLERQVAVVGTAEKVSTKESLQYFSSRPYGSQLGAWVSQQSKVISSRSVLEVKLAEMKRKFKEGKVPLPDFWGGYRIIPESIEFWQGRQSRLHDRLIYEKDEAGNWNISRMAP
ncbi:pyridoxamine 5'-phosphate oxidase [Roseivirga pacifica]|uniref:pyridoxamine 5'-phosphate oxidase n=1 Tax=Roseivirga pacifica TaxID=1267423 RepID=UPI002095378F|nr:pyridoxamine 5'-phosphate oxidase [Roseivirga pacifica]MCO6360423.1 pyridoxamine 5'-phosphate oxidase [Roseivirga pacifica]MCO6368312.1 pyridoxamine 5'-phosphate oxidase [Roseivirga pacifica]MCO6372454.1 pyridoxamine 5'-phosphate oxidase [Roseivirga pacifica]MCO6376512.1 pyridoxamine 5'-phosphate oxidase [Roseivirga pacifica]MCO6378208.1 pyridoxamine 5'-phosphate oxidase [Roseivirga pacifica]